MMKIQSPERTMKNRSKVRILSALAFALFWLCPAALPKGTDVKFDGTVSKVEQSTTTTGTVTVRAVGFDIPVKVTADSDIVLHGDKVGLAGIKVNDFVKVDGFFSSSGIVADEIQILDDAKGQFRLRGPVTAVATSAAGTTITVLGVAVLVDADTTLERRGPDGGITLADLKTGVQVDTTGTQENGVLVATRVKVGNREDDAVRVEFDGKITSNSDGRLLADTEGGGIAVVLVTDSTVVKGTLAVGEMIRVKGTLNSQLEVVADRIIVEGQEDHDDHEGEEHFRKEVDLLPVTSGITLKGEANVEYEKEGDESAEQKLKVEIRRAEPGKEYRILVTFGSAAAVDFGPLVADDRGNAGVRFSSNPKGKERDLRPLLQTGTVRDITKLQISDSSKTVLIEGSF
jgi:hypothetical protein